LLEKTGNQSDNDSTAHKNNPLCMKTPKPKERRRTPFRQSPNGKRLRALLLRLASRYIWWKTPEEAVRLPKRVMAQVMELGTYEDVLQLTQTAGQPALKNVIQTAEAGWFSPESWHFWNYRLNLCEIGHVPPLPQKKIPAT
jgi:hypothetical protein